ncbi:unnamed protein product [Mucor hiemalis]
MYFLANAPLYIILLFISHCSAYCFYNDLPEGAGTYSLQQQALNTGGNYFSRFKKGDFKPGESACCPYTSKDCNKNGDPNELLEMMIIRKIDNNVPLHPYVLTFPAGGGIRMSGSKNPSDDKLDIFNSDGTRFEKTRVDHNI